MILHGKIDKTQGGMRLDVAAHALFPQLSKQEIRRIIDWGGGAVNGTMVRVASRILKPGDELTLGVMEPERRVELVLGSDDILYEDADYLVINKGAGINSQRTPYQLKGTVEHAVGVHLAQQGITGPVMIAHRLDRGTSGVMVFPKNRKAAAHFSRLLHDGEVEKRYWALVAGTPAEDAWTIDAPIAKIASAKYGVARPGKEARTEFRLLAAGDGMVLVEAKPLTGRTHQIRVHLAHCGLPIVGDRTYGGVHASRMMLHCRMMAFLKVNGSEVRAEAPVDGAFLETQKNQICSTQRREDAKISID